MMIKKSIKINISRILIHFVKLFISPAEMIKKFDIFKNWVYFEPLLIGKLFDKYHIGNYQKDWNKLGERLNVSKFWLNSIYCNEEAFW